MASKYHKLHSKTILDFTDDEEMIHDIIVIDKERYLEEIKENPAINAFHLLQVAERTNDNGLKSAVHSQFQDVLGFVKHNPDDKVYWIESTGEVGKFLFSFNKKKVFNLFADYPHKLTKEQKQIFDEENPEWADFFKDRQ